MEIRPAVLRLQRRSDLTNDGVVKLAEKSPFADLPGLLGSGFFEELQVMLDFGAGLGQRPSCSCPKSSSLVPTPR